MGFVFYERSAGYDWYQCDCCGALSIGRPKVCPVCEGRGRAAAPAPDSSAFDASQRRLRELIEKYGSEMGGNDNG